MITDLAMHEFNIPMTTADWLVQGTQTFTGPVESACSIGSGSTFRLARVANAPWLEDNRHQECDRSLGASSWPIDL
jgi:hypothetical protein